MGALKTRAGFTLISVALAVVMLCFGVIALSRAMSGALAAGAQTNLRTVALDIGRQRMEFLRAQDPSDLSSFQENATQVDESGRSTGGLETRVFRRTVTVATIRENLVSVTVRIDFPRQTSPVQLLTYVYTGAVSGT